MGSDKYMNLYAKDLIVVWYHHRPTTSRASEKRQLCNKTWCSSCILHLIRPLNATRLLLWRQSHYCNHTRRSPHLSRISSGRRRDGHIGASVCYRRLFQGSVGNLKCHNTHCCDLFPNESQSLLVLMLGETANVPRMPTELSTSCCQFIFAPISKITTTAKLKLEL